MNILSRLFGNVRPEPDVSDADAIAQYRRELAILPRHAHPYSAVNEHCANAINVSLDRSPKRRAHATAVAS